MKNQLTVLISLILTSCINVPVDIGTGPIELSPRAQAAYEKYASSRKPYMFVVTEDGKHFQYYYCEEARCLRGGGTARAIDDCQKWSGGRRCYVYDRDGKIVWNRDKPFRGNDKALARCAEAQRPAEELVEACSQALAAIDLRPQDRLITHRRRAFAYLKLEQYPEAIADLSAVLDNDDITDKLDISERALGYWHLGRGEAYEALGDLESARADFAKAVQYAPNLSIAKEALERVSG